MRARLARERDDMEWFFHFSFIPFFFFFLSGMVTSGIQVSLCISDFGHQALFFFFNWK